MSFRDSMEQYADQKLTSVYLQQIRRRWGVRASHWLGVGVVVSQVLEYQAQLSEKWACSIEFPQSHAMTFGARQPHGGQEIPSPQSVTPKPRNFIFELPHPIKQDYRVLTSHKLAQRSNLLGIGQPNSCQLFTD